VTKRVAGTHHCFADVGTFGAAGRNGAAIDVGILHVTTDNAPGN
jgi:hypothetical protein